MASTYPQPTPGELPAGDPTPAMAHYLTLRAQNPGFLLFYRMGDFYELFFEDAEAAARALDIALTKRGKHQGRDIPMCGVPVHAAETYLSRLISKGFKVAVCEQMEDPAAAKRRGAKALRREIVRLVTPGTLTEENLLKARANNFIVSVAAAGRPGDASLPQLGIAWLDISTGDLVARAASAETLAADFARLNPAEILIGERLSELPALGEVLALQGAALSVLAPAHFDSTAAERLLGEVYGVRTLDGFGAFSRAEVAALGGLVAYARDTQKGRLPLLKAPRREVAASVLALDAATRSNLEILVSLRGTREGSVLAAIDRTVTSGGGRALASRLSAPSCDPQIITARLDAIEFFLTRPAHLESSRAHLKEAPDLARAMARLSLGRGGPRDLAQAGAALSVASALAAQLSAAVAEGSPLGEAPGEIADALSALKPSPKIEDLRDELSRALAGDLPLLARDGGFVRAGYSEKIDAARAARDGSRTLIAGLETRLREASGVSALRIKHNNVLGYFIEASATHGPKLLQPPHSETFIHRQTMAGAYRFTTAELSSLASRILDAGAESLALELEAYDRLVAQVIENGARLQATADALAALDVAAGLAALAFEEHYVRPRIDRSLSFRIDGGRHPVVEQSLKEKLVPFIANGCVLGKHEETKILLVTGPNMAGKSTYLRQNALIALMAHMGSFVPAREAHIGMIDRIFSRVGAGDDLAAGRSTFMVEMVETAAILNQATERSLVILDEIGRGTATYDGLAIAWASLEHLHEAVRPRALFATHFHELTALSAKLKRLEPVTMRVREWKSEIVFLHEVVPGAADRSYGIQVARLAGLPAAVVERAQAVLAELEASADKNLKLRIEELPLFSRPVAAGPPRANLADDIRVLDVDAMSPREALEALYALKARALEDR